MKMIHRSRTFDGYLDMLHMCLEKGPQSVRISTTGLGAGMLEDGQDIRKAYSMNEPVAAFLDKLAGYPAWLVVGLPPPRDPSPAQACADCRCERLRTLSKLAAHARAWPAINWGFVAGGVPRVAVFQYGEGFRVVAGDRQLSDFPAGSPGQAFLLEGTDSEDAEVFDELWAKSMCDHPQTWNTLAQVLPRVKPLRVFDPLSMIGVSAEVPVDDIPF